MEEGSLASPTLDASPQPPSCRRSRRGRRGGRIRLAIQGAVLVALALFVFACAARRALFGEIASTARDPASGVVIGAEAIDLDPPRTRGATLSLAGESSADPPTSACLLLHGWVGSRKDFADLGERLAAAGFHVRLARLPGHGTTSLDFAAQTPDSMIEGVEAEFRALRGRYAEVNVVGFSMGGTLATLLAAREDVDRLVLVAPYFRVTHKWYYVLPVETWNGVAGWMLPYIRKPEWSLRLNRPDERRELYFYRVIPRECVRILTDLGRRAGRNETLKGVGCPVLLVMSEGDEAASPAAAKKAAGRMPAIRRAVRMFPERSNHHILRDHDAEAAKQAIVEFLTD